MIIMLMVGPVHTKLIQFIDAKYIGLFRLNIPLTYHSALTYRYFDFILGRTQQALVV